MKISMKELRNIVREESRAASAPLRKQATDNMGKLNYGQPVDTPNTSPAPGINFARCVRALAAGRGDQREALRLARNADMPGAVTKFLSSGDFDAGGALVGGELAAEVIELLRARTVVRQAGPRIVRPNKGTLTFPRITAGASADYFGEGADITVSEPTTGDLVLSVKRLGALVSLTSELLRFTNDSADEIVRDDILAAMAEKEDSVFLRGDGTEFEPKGLLNLAASANIITANATVNTNNTITDMTKLMNQLDSSNVPLTKPWWFFSPRTKNFLFSLLDANSNFVFRPEMQNGTIFGIPFAWTTTIPSNLDTSGGGNNNETDIYLVDMDQVVLGEVDQIEVSVSTEAAFKDSGGTMQSSFQRGLVLVRAVLRHDFNVRHPEAVAILRQAAWTL